MMATQHTQYPDARLSSPIVLDQCDLVTRACGLYSEYSLNPKLKTCRLPKHIYRLKYDTIVLRFISDVPVATIPIDYIAPMLINVLADSKNVPLEPPCLSFLDEIVNYTVQDAAFLNYYMNQIKTQEGVITDQLKQNIRRVIHKNRYLSALFFWHDLAILTRRGRMNRGNVRSTWFVTNEVVDILGYGDYIFWKIPIALLPMNTANVPHASTDWYQPNIFKEAIQGHTHIISVSTAEVLIMCKDLVTSRFNTLLIAELARLEDPVSADYPLVDNIQSLYNAGDYLLSILGSEGYKIIKYLEPLCLAKIQLCSNIQNEKGGF